MIVLDTNVVSELMSPNPERVVLRWAQGRSEVYGTTAVTVAEVTAGIARMPSGRRRRAFERAAESIFASFAAEVLPFDLTAAECYAEVLATRFSAGHPIAVLDAQIAAICRAHDATLATRNTRDFEGTGVRAVNPWQ